MKLLYFLPCIIFTLSTVLALAEDPKIQVGDISTHHDSGIVIRSGKQDSLYQPDFEVISSTDEVSGDPMLGRKEALNSWKQACAEWKKELKETNGKQLISASCGKSQATAGPNNETTFSSHGTYKMRVRIRGKSKDEE